MKYCSLQAREENDGKSETPYSNIALRHCFGRLETSCKLLKDYIA